MTVVRRKLLALAIVLPMLAIGAFTFATPVAAACDGNPSQCCFAGNSYSLGSCLHMGGCWLYIHQCVQGGVDAYWQECAC